MSLHLVELVTTPDQVTVQDVLEVFAHGGWTRSRTYEQVKQMLDHTSVLVLARIDGRPVGFARAVTDRAFRAFVEDVIVLPEFRHRGVGTRIMARLEELVKQFGVPRMELVTAQPDFWRQLGYKPKPGSTYMVKTLA